MTILLPDSIAVSAGVVVVSTGVVTVSAGMVVVSVCIGSVVTVESAGTGGKSSGAIDLLLEESLPQALRTRSAAAERERLVLVLKFIVTSLGV
jgi:hypothetical protein